MMACGEGGGGIAPLILYLSPSRGDWSTLCPDYFSPGQRAPLPIGQDTRWSPELVWTFWRRACWDSNPRLSSSIA